MRIGAAENPSQGRCIISARLWEDMLTCTYAGGSQAAMQYAPPVMVAVVTPTMPWLSSVMAAKAFPLVQVDIVSHAASSMMARVSMLGYWTCTD